MFHQKSGTAVVGILLGFLFILLSVNFFHTEKGPGTNETCPACHFQQSSLSLGPTLPVQLPSLCLIAVLLGMDFSFIAPVSTCDFVSRSPPWR